MPVRSLRSSVLKWPDREDVDAAVREWAARVASSRPDVVRLGYFGSYARGDWGVGSDLDLVVVVEETDVPFHLRGSGWDVTGLPVPAEVVVYTAEEWAGLPERSRFGRDLHERTVWVYERGGEGRPPVPSGMKPDATVSGGSVAPCARPGGAGPASAGAAGGEALPRSCTAPCPGWPLLRCSRYDGAARGTSPVVGIQRVQGERGLLCTRSAGG